MLFSSSPRRRDSCDDLPKRLQATTTTQQTCKGTPSKRTDHSRPSTPPPTTAASVVNNVPPLSPRSSTSLSGGSIIDPNNPRSHSTTCSKLQVFTVAGLIALINMLMHLHQQRAINVMLLTDSSTSESLSSFLPAAGGKQRLSSSSPVVSSNKNKYEPTDIVYMAYYYPWYQSHDWNRHPYKFVPQLGLYNTSDPSIVEQHIDWMVDNATIDGVLVSWDESNVVLTKHLDVGFLKARNLHKFKNGWSILYESKESLPHNCDFAHPETFDKLVSDMKILEEKYFGLDSYWKVGGIRPVVTLYLTRNWKNWTLDMMDQLQRTMKDDVLFVADEPYTGGGQRFVDLARHGRVNESSSVEAPDEANLRGGSASRVSSFSGFPNGHNTADRMWFEAYTSYNAYEPNFIQPNDTAASYMLREGTDVYHRWSQETYMIPHVLPKYHDFREGNPDLIGTTEGLWKQLETFTCLPRSTPIAQQMARHVFLTSWNEWWEGTQLEPDVNGTSGSEWLDTLKRFKESNYPCPPTAEEEVESSERMSSDSLPLQEKQGSKKVEALQNFNNIIEKKEA